MMELAAIWYSIGCASLGRSGALGYELVGSQPSCRQVSYGRSEANSNATFNVQRQFTDVDDELGAHELSQLTFTYSRHLHFDLMGTLAGLTRGWNRIHEQFQWMLGKWAFWRDGDEIFEAKVSQNWRDPHLGHYPFGSSANPALERLDGTQVGPLKVALRQPALTAKQLRSDRTTAFLLL